MTLLLSGLLCVAASAQEVEPEPSSADQLLERFDANGDGRISPEEIESRFLRQRFLVHDANGDGVLDPDELQNIPARGVRRALRPARQPRGEAETLEFEASTGRSLPYSILAPDQSSTESLHPLVVCLHGRGGSSQAAKVLAQATVRSRYPAYVLTPRCSDPETRWANPSGVDPKGELRVEILELIERLLETHPIDPDRIYLTGQSMGGAGTWGVAVARPGRFAAAVPVCGRWQPEDASRLRNLPIWAFHGADDRTVPVSGSRDMIEALREVGANPRYTEYEGVGHGSWGPAYATDELWEWLFSQRRSPSRGTDSENEEAGRSPGR